jgi:archaellum component FlaC
VFSVIKSKVKVYLGIALVALAGIASAVAAIYKNQRDKAVSEKQKVESDLNKVVEVNKHNETINAVEKEIDKVSDDVHSMSNSDIDTGMHEYDRARSNKDGDNMRW